MTPAQLIEARERLGLSTSALAKRLHVTVRAIQQWESGSTKRIPGPVAVAIDFMLAEAMTKTGEGK